MCAGSSTLTFDSVSIVTHRRIPGRWAFHRESTHVDQESFWRSYEAIDPRGQAHYTVCPDAATSLNLLGWWDRVQSGVYTVNPGRLPTAESGRSGKTPRRRGGDPLILSGCPDVIGFRSGNIGVRVPGDSTGSNRRYNRSPKPARFRWVGVRQFGDPEFEKWPDSRAGAWIVSEWIRTIMSRWLDSGCGAWKDTTGAAAWSTYRLRSKRCQITDHNHPAALKLESAACHGGRAAIFTVRPIGTENQWKKYESHPPYPSAYKRLSGQAHRFDVRAMYPTLMRDGWYPTRFVGTSRGWTTERLSRVCENTCVIARVTIRSVRGAVPYRSHGLSLYPVGTFVTTLATPELVECLELGEVSAVHEIARYESGRPFEDWGKWVLGLRTRSKVIGPPSWSDYVKSLSVSLSGKLARVGGGWEVASGVYPSVEWGEFHRQCADTGKSRLFRALGGVIQEMIVGDHRPGTLAACYAHLTSYGRVQMNRLRHVCGHRQVLSQHTDGLAVTDAARTRLTESGLVREGEYGHLQYESSHDCLLLKTPNHFWRDGKWTVAGVHAGFTVNAASRASAETIHDPARLARDPTVYPIIERVNSVDLTQLGTGERISWDGWVIHPKIGSQPSAQTDLTEGIE